jgi:hypothetical protein
MIKCLNITFIIVLLALNNSLCKNMFAEVLEEVVNAKKTPPMPLQSQPSPQHANPQNQNVFPQNNVNKNVTPVNSVIKVQSSENVQPKSIVGQNTSPNSNMKIIERNNDRVGKNGQSHNHIKDNHHEEKKFLALMKRHTIIDIYID